MKYSRILFIILIGFSSCKKDTIRLPEPGPIDIPVKEFKVKFVFVNRIGFRNDSTKHGVNDTVFQGPCMDGKYFDKTKSTTTISNICFNRNNAKDNFPVSDSMTFDFGIFDRSIGSRYGYQIELVWKCPTYPYTTIVHRNITKNYTNGDTIKV